MTIELIGVIDSEKESIFNEVDSMGFDWDYIQFGFISVTGSDYCVIGFTMYLTSINILWTEV